MGDIKVVGDPKKGNPTSLLDEQKQIKKRISKVRKDFFPAWVIVVIMALMWGMILVGSTIILVQNPISGMLTGLSVVLVSTISVLAYETYTPKWRTMAWAMLISLASTYLLTQLDDFSGKLLFIVVPTFAVVFARANMNLRKFIENRRLNRLK